VEIHVNKAKKVEAVEIWLVDPPYEPPEGDGPPTNPGVADDFGCRRDADPTPKAHGEATDNRYQHPEGENQTGCRIQVVPEDRPGLRCPDPGFSCSSACRMSDAAGKPCIRVDVPSSGTHAWKAAAILRTSRFGGDNHKLVAAAARGNLFVCKPPVEGPTLTVWRKLWLRIDQMHIGEHTDVTNDSPYVRNALADGFYKIEKDVVTGWDRRPHKETLEPENNPAICARDQEGSNENDPDREPWLPLEYCHEYITDYHSPTDAWCTPLHTMHLVGSHWLRLCTGNNASLFYGLYCPTSCSPLPLLPGLESHSWTAEDCMRGLYGLGWGYDPASDHPCYEENRRLPNPHTLQWRVAVHEIGHNIAVWPWGTNPNFNDICHPPGQPEGCEGRQPLCGESTSHCTDLNCACNTDSIMEYDCLYDLDFAGYFNKAQIMDLRQGNFVRQ
jgi:hypothetical protein